MERKRAIASTPEKGKIRYQLYKNCIDKYKDALYKGFYLEAVALMESLIADRLASYLVYVGKLQNKDQFITVGESLTHLRGEKDFPVELRQRIASWKDQRNKYLHEMAKFEEGENPSFDERYDECKTTAEEGYSIFTEIKRFESANRRQK